MGIKLSGMVSGLDTDSIVKELMSAQSLKKTKVENKQTKLNWTQEKWADLNKKLLALYTGTLTKVKTQGSYNTKKVSTSDDTKATATASNSASKGAHSLEISSLASAQYLTGGVITKSDGSTVSSTTKLTELGIDENTVITIKAAKTDSTTNNSNIQKLTVSSTSTIADFVSACKNAGLNANFDATQKRLFISSADSGSNQKFSITTTSVSADLATNTEDLKKQTGYNDSTTTTAQKAELDSYYATLTTADSTSTEYQDAYDKLLEFAQRKSEADYASKYTTGKQEYKELKLSESYTSVAKEELLRTNPEYTDQAAWEASDEFANWKDANGWADDTIAANEDAYNTAVAAAYSAAYNTALEPKYTLVSTGEAFADVRTEKQAEVDALMADIEAGTDLTNDYNPTADASDTVREAIDLIKNSVGIKDTLSEQVASDAATVATTISNYVANSVELEAGETPDGNSLLTKLGLAEITGETEISSMTADNVSGLTLTTAKNAKFVLDDATMETASNNCTVNYITFDLKGTTTAGNPIKITVENDTDTIYNTVKSFVKEFNSILQEMNDMYYADSSKGYDPLSDEEKEAMTDDEVEKWETKIKDALLRRDSTVGTLTSAMKTALMGQVTIDGKKVSLSSFGIRTSSDYTEKGLLHIYGDSEDDTYSDEDNDLKSMLETNPDLVMKGLSKICQNLYDTMTDKMASSSLSSYKSFYNDKQMKTQNTTYKKEISDWEDKLSDLENRYYSQFTAMETALSKLQNQSNSLSSLLGTS